TPATLRDKYHEAHDLIIKAWTEPEPFSWNGKFTQLRYVNVWPRPVQKPHPPVWVPGGSSPETAEWVVDKDYLYAHLSMSGHKRAKIVIDDFHALAARNGREYNPYRVGMTQYVFVADNDEQAEELYSEHASYFFQKSLHIYRGFTDAPGYRSQRSIESGLAAQGFGRSSLAPPNAGWKQYLEQGSIIAGSPKSVTEQLRETAKKMRVGHLMILIHIGSLGHEATMRNVKLLGEQVLPNLRDIWPEYEDHWGIRPLKQRVAMATAN
ncbi:MAG TPA: LLM class flavin-dependent oxidoreductase, partial [Dehalococcoidia bacterium]|nr:LLM class flavin-dependent oxidoreductase [Dehalococcoidia bacterium]